MSTSSDWLYVPSLDYVDFLRLTMWTSSDWLYVDFLRLTVCGLHHTECLLTSSDWLCGHPQTVCELPQTDCMWTSSDCMWTSSDWLYVDFLRLTVCGLPQADLCGLYVHIFRLTASGSSACILSDHLHTYTRLYLGSNCMLSLGTVEAQITLEIRSLLVCTIHISMMVPQSRPLITQPNVSIYIYLICMLQTYYIYFQT